MNPTNPNFFLPDPPHEINRIRRRPRLKVFVAVIVLTTVTLILNLTGINWGLPGRASWNYDSIAGIPTARMIPTLYKSWVGERYPRAHFLITGNFYIPFIRNWRQHPDSVLKDPDTGRVVKDPDNGMPINVWDDPARYKLIISVDWIAALIRISRMVTVAMAVGAVLGVYATILLICRDSLAAFLGAAALMLSPEFTFFSHLGNLDIPALFWFSWSAFFAVMALQNGKMVYYGLLGLFAGITVCTKDHTAGHIAGLAVFILFMVGIRYLKGNDPVKGDKRILFDPHLWTALAGFAAVFLLLNNVLTDYPAFKIRLDHWLSVKNAYEGPPGQQWRLIGDAFNCLRQDLGLWMFIVLIVSMGYCAVKYPIIFLWGVTPFVVYHLIVTTSALQVQPRYHLASIVCMTAVIGKGGSDWLRTRKIPMSVRTVLLISVFTLQGIMAIAVPVEMNNDSRYRAEAWIRNNLDRQKHTLTFLSPSIYMPRCDQDGFNVVYQLRRSEKYWTDETVLANEPEIIAISETWYTDTLFFDQNFRKKLLGGELGYDRIAEFGSLQNFPSKNLFRIAGLTVRPGHQISPRIIVMQRRTPRCQDSTPGCLRPDT